MKYEGLIISRVSVLLLLLAACSPSEAQIVTTIAQTELAKPTATVTPEPTATPTQTVTPTKRPTSTPKPTNTSTWDRYKPGTIGQIVSDTHGELASLADKAFYYNYGDDYASEVVAIYTGQFRPISERRTFLIVAWLAQLGRTDAINWFTTEGLFIEDSTEYWLPIQSPLIPLMKDELTEGKPASLFIIWIGATFFDNELDRVFLVNEFLATPRAIPTLSSETTTIPYPTVPEPAKQPDVIGWEGTTSLPIASSAPFDDARGQQLIFHNDYVYIFGGASVGEPRLTNVYFSAIGQDGTLAEWVKTTSLPGKYYDHVVVKTGEYVYLLSGADGAEDVYYAPFNVDGSIGTWKKTASLSPSRQQFAAVSHGNFIYATGGNSGGNQAFVQYTSAKPDGTLNNWTSTTPLPDRIQAHTMIAYNGYLYVFGGKNTSDVWVTAVYFSAINEDGTLAGWETTTPMPRQMSGYSTFESNGYVYLVGGSSSSSYYTRILENHTLDVWEEATSLPNKNILGLRTGAYNGFAYAVGGYKGGYQRTVYFRFIGSRKPPESPTPAPETQTPPVSSTPAPETLTPGPLTCQLNINQIVHVLDGTNRWSQPDVVNGSLTGTLPAGTSVYVISAPAWGRIVETGVSGWWWEISNQSNGASAGWIWEGRIEECN